MDQHGSSDPIDFDFFDEGPSTKRSSRSNAADPKPNRPQSGKRSGSARGYDGDNDRESVRSAASSRSSVSVRIPTATPTHDDGNEADYYSDDFDDSDKERQKAKNGSDTFRFNDEIDALKEKRHERGGDGRNGKATSKTGPKSRPKTSVSRRRSHSSSSNSSTESSRSSSSFTSESSQSHRDNDSVTDVSPLQSPRSSPIPKLEYDEQAMDRETERMRSVHFEEDDIDSYRDSNERRAKGRPKSSKTRESRKVTKTPGYSQYNEDPRLRETEAKELSMLLRAVLELDETPKESDLSALHKNLKRPISGKRKSRPQSAPMPHQRMNMSFSNDEVKRIDKDNSRLLEKIIGRSSEPSRSGRGTRPSSAKHTTNAPEKPVSHSAVKRQREQRRIEIENMQILKRIEAARANPEVEKNALMKDYHQQMQYATQVSKTPGGPRSRPTSAKRSGKAYSTGGMNRASSMSSLGTDFSGDTFTSSSTGRSRPRSAKWSGYKAGKPAWDDRFYLDG
ncbi:cilia- and flagella-associated protein 97 [Strongylocentrotus purpuratus]|uniref:Cilia- and flagella-associated protein 97 n=1 Tax=Strongylocentrotus purpuratus TaxID=7668 RepID=A0A7M7RF41_STRPU|nr:cilia- and flagella-associated protein 97 [Strongylocentrotus purpuratus]